MFAERIDIELGHVFDAVQGLLVSVDARCLNSVNGMSGANMLGKFEELHVAAEARRNEHRRLVVAVLDLDNGRESGKTGLLQNGSESCDSAGVADRGTGNQTAVDLSDLGKELIGQPVGTAEVEEVLISAYGRPLQHMLPNRGKGFDCSEHGLRGRSKHEGHSSRRSFAAARLKTMLAEFDPEEEGTVVTAVTAGSG